MARGDHIKVRRWGFIYTHHGIDMGDGTVIHFSGEPLQLSRARVVRSDYATFCDGGTCSVVSDRGPVRDPNDVVAMAEALLETGSYCLLLNNCEHFATYCRTGVTKSYQVRRLAWVAGVTHVTVAIAVLSVVRVVKRKRYARSTL